ncbi:hypothetical protein CH379_003105 [Leptospira ellisii]|uniref:Uncharacterized protein n=1 Tax=Leptospira ellisii TaxID=2023197 RepID=A0AAE4QLA5_9LEPT|nr:hypothetical protein [Leptospira ellisii]MDV6234615.1 hypothetical protein [Leptospira ellisii]
MLSVTILHCGNNKDGSIAEKLALFGQTASVINRTQNTPRLNVLLRDQNSAQNTSSNRTSASTAATAVSNDLLQGIYFAGIDIRAFDFRPTTAAGSDPSNPSVEWDYWEILPSYPYRSLESTDNVLLKGSSVSPNWIPSEQYIPKREVFELDVISVNLDETGIVYDDGFYSHALAANGSDQGSMPPLYKYPQWSAIPNYNVSNLYPILPPKTETLPDGSSVTYGTDTPQVSILFVRRDILASPVSLEVHFNHTIGNFDSIFRSSRPLTAEEEELILSLYRQMYLPSPNIPVYLYPWVVLIPFDAPVNVSVKGTTDENNQTYSWRDLDISINMDLSNSIDTVKTTLDPWWTSKVFFDVDQNKVPFHLNLNVVKKNSQNGN